MQKHQSQPLNDFIEYPHDEMLKRATEFLQTSQRRHSIRIPRQVERIINRGIL